MIIRKWANLVLLDNRIVMFNKTLYSRVARMYLINYIFKI